MSFDIYLIYSKQTKTFSNVVSYPNRDEGVLGVKRWEWGIGKGKWKRQVRQAAECMGVTGKLRAFYFLIGSFYTGEYKGRSNDIDALYTAI